MKHIGKTFDALTREDKKAWTDQALVRDRRCNLQRSAKEALVYRQDLVWSEDKTMGPCACNSCREFRRKVPSGKPLLCSLMELSDANPGGQKDVLCSFSGLAQGQGRELDWGELIDRN